jgi:hypothetical protein
MRLKNLLAMVVSWAGRGRDGERETHPSRAVEWLEPDAVSVAPWPRPVNRGMAARSDISGMGSNGKVTEPWSHEGKRFRLAKVDDLRGFLRAIKAVSAARSFRVVIRVGWGHGPRFG